MKRLFSGIGTVLQVILTILGIVVAGVLALGLVALATGETGAFVGALVLAIIIAVPMAIAYVVARVVHKPAIPQIAPPPPAPDAGFQPYPHDGQHLHHPDHLR